MKKTILHFTIFFFGVASAFSQISATSIIQVLLPNQPSMPHGSIVEPSGRPLPVSIGKNDSTFIFTTDVFFLPSQAIADNDSMYSEFLQGTPPVQATQNIMIPQGWSGISSYLLPFNTNIEQLFQPILGSLVILQNETGFYWPGQNINTLVTWNTYKGYKIKVTNAVGLTISGSTENTHTLQLTPGWNLIPVLYGSNVNVVSLFEGTNVVVVKEIAGQSIYWPQYGINTLGVIEPGKAYYVMMGSNTSITFPITNPTAPPPPPAHHTTSATSSGSGSTYFYRSGDLVEIVKTPVTHLIAIPQDLLLETEIADNSLIAAFDSENQCFGITTQKAGNFALTVFGDDPTTSQKDGFYEGEQMFFRQIAPDSSRETLLNGEFDQSQPQRDGTFAENGLSALAKISIKNNCWQPGEDEICIFPNPASKRLLVKTEDWKNAKIEITNFQGQSIYRGMTACNITEVDISSFAPGIFIIKVYSGTKQYFKQIVKQ